MNRVFLFTAITVLCVYLTPAELPLPTINPYHARTMPSYTTTSLAPRSPLQAPFALPHLQRVPSGTTTQLAPRTIPPMGRGRVEMVGAGAGAGAGAGDAKSSSHMGKQLPKQPAQRARAGTGVVRSKGNNSTVKVSNKGIRVVSNPSTTQSHPSITVRTTVRNSERTSAHSVTRTHSVTQSSHVRR